MSKVKVLSDALASQVAAGEVVERPAAVVKELLENSIDAGARRIDILVRSGGVALIKIVDDGSGMGREDALLCVERHATSKLRTKEDLAAITTMGFRGEALPSIASVSRFTLTTREHGALCGTQVSIDGGRLLGVNEAGEAPGTHIEVRNLFYNVPARRKFLRSENTEFSHIEQQVRVHALAYPEVAFSLTRDDRLIFHLPGGSALRERIAGLAGAEIAAQLIEVEERTLRGVTVRGFIGRPGSHRSSRALQFTFLNRRPVESSVFNYALRGAYAEALPRGTWPVALLFLSLDPAEVDVNVHPAKREVRFRDTLGVQSALMEMLGEALQQSVRRSAEPAVQLEHSPPARPLPVMNWKPSPVQPALIPEKEQHSLRRDWSPMLTPRADPAPPAVESAAHAPDNASDGEPPTTSTPGAEPQAPVTEPPMPFRVLHPLGDQYWLLQSGDGLVVLSPSAAWERILFEETRARAAAGGAATQALLAPLAVTLSPREHDLLRPHFEKLRLMGLGVEDFGGNTVMLHSLPPGCSGDGDPHALLSLLVDELQKAGDRAPRHRLDDDSLAAAVARQAARFQPPASHAEVTRLVQRLLSCEMPYCCPAGNPTLILFSFQELARKFGRR